MTVEHGGVDTRGRRSLSISLAGLTFQISSNRAISLRDPRSSYGEFAGIEHSGSVQVPTRLHLGEGPRLTGESKVFAGNNLWSVYREGARRRLIACHDPNLQPAHVWTASLDVDRSDVEVFCAPHCLRQEAGDLTLMNPVVFPLDQVLCMYLLAGRSGVVLHSCGFETAGRGIVLAGRSGAGKTTSARFLEPRGDVTVFSDDRTIVRRHEDGWRVHGTPWPGDAGIARNGSAPLTALLFLTKAGDNTIVPIEAADALRRVLIVASVPWYDAEYMPPVLDTLDRLLAEVPCYEFRFRNDPSAAEAAVTFAASRPAGRTEHHVTEARVA